MDHMPGIDIGDAQRRLCCDAVLAAALGLRDDLAQQGITLDAGARCVVLARLQDLFWASSKGTEAEIAAALTEAGVDVNLRID